MLPYVLVYAQAEEAWERKELLNFTFAELDYLIVQVDLFLIEVFY